MTNRDDKTKDAADPTNAAGAKHPGSERERDEHRDDAGPQYGGGSWEQADRRGNARFGHARNDDADLSELAPGETESDDDDEALDADDADGEQAAEIESGGERAGVGRGEQPRKPKSEDK